MSVGQATKEMFRREYGMSLREAADYFADNQTFSTGEDQTHPKGPSISGRGHPALGKSVDAEKCHQENIRILRNW